MLPAQIEPAKERFQRAGGVIFHRRGPLGRGVSVGVARPAEYRALRLGQPGLEFFRGPGLGRSGHIADRLPVELPGGEGGRAGGVFFQDAGRQPGRQPVGPQDVALAIIGATFGCGYVKNKVMEFVGPGVDKLSADFRIGVDVMTTETTCLSSIWKTDEKIEEWYETHYRPECYKELNPGAVAYYDGVVYVDLSKVKPMIAMPFHPSNVYTIEDVKANLMDVLDDVEKRAQVSLDGKIDFTLKDKVYSMYVQDVNLNQPININSMSDGARRVFLMLTITVIAELEGISLIAIEEPENSVHPGLLQSYLSVLAQLAGNCRILIASHSPYIVQYVNTEDIYIGKPNSDGLADFARVKSAKVNALLRDSINEGMSVGDYIFDLLSGGEDDAAVLCGYLEG